MHAEAPAVVIASPQTLGRLGEQMLRKIMGPLFRSQFRLQHMLRADAFREARRGRLDVDAMQHLVEQHAVDAAPHPPQLQRRRIPQLLDGEDSGTVQSLLHSWADALDVLQFEAEQNAG
jgi:hypothetical protein